MRKSGFPIAFALVAALAVTAGTARAEFFEYSTVGTVDPITGISSVTNNGSSSVVMTTTGSDAITFTGFSTGGPNHLSTPTNIVFGDIGVSVTDTSPYQDIAFNFTWTLTLTGYDSSSAGTPTGTGVLEVTGRLGGSIGAGRSVLLNNLQNYAISPPGGYVDIGMTRYTVALSPFVPPGPDFNGRFGAVVSAQMVPEPASMVSIGLGAIGLVGFAWRRRRRPAA